MKGTWQHDSKIEVERYDAYPGTKPKVGGVELQDLPAATTAEYADLLADNLDVMKHDPDREPDHRAERPGRPVTSTARPRPSSSLAFPTFDQAFSNADVRKAISMAIDREEIDQGDLQGLAAVRRAPSSRRSSPGYRDEHLRRRPASTTRPRPRSCTHAAGGPAKITITYNADGGHKDWVDATCNQLKTNLGVDCVGTPEPKFADLLTKVKKKQTVGMFRMGWVMDYPSMENYLGPLYTTDGSSNYYGYSNPEFDNLVKEGSAATTPDEAIEKYQAAEDILAKDMPVHPAAVRPEQLRPLDQGQNVQMDLFNRVDLNKIEVRQLTTTVRPREPTPACAGPPPEPGALRTRRRWPPVGRRTSRLFRTTRSPRLRHRRD